MLNPTNKKFCGARGIPQSFSRQSGRASHSKQVVQQKTSVSAQSLQPPSAPVVHRPQATPKTAQARMAKEAVKPKSPAAPPVYHPQRVPKVLQTRMGKDRTGRQACELQRTVQRTLAGVVQLVTCKKCGQQGHTQQKCYLYSNTKANPNSQAKQQSKEQLAYNAFSGYRSDFFADNDVNVGHVRAFFLAGYSLHGHGSGGSGSGENYATKGDADTFVGWFRSKY